MRSIKVQFETDSYCPYCNNIHFLIYGKGKIPDMVRCMGCFRDFELNQDKSEWIEVLKNKVDSFEDISKTCGD